MNELVIKDLSETLRQRLEMGAEFHGWSVAEEARALLETATGLAGQAGTDNIARLGRRLFGADNGFDLDLPPRGSAPVRHPPRFSD
jgi:plasmid stability protein